MIQLGPTETPYMAIRTYFTYPQPDNDVSDYIIFD